jgi:hypothetical protein
MKLSDQARETLEQGPNPYERFILLGLQRKPHVYGGTVPYGEKLRRRRKNRLARVARRINRGV